MEPITLAIAGMVFLVTAAVSVAVTHYRTKVAAKNADIDKLRTSLEQYASTYQFEPCDAPVIAAVRKYISGLRAKGNLSGIMQDMDLNDRKAYTARVVRDIAKAMDIGIDDINICDLGLFVHGAAYNEDGRFKIDINEALLIADPDALLNTICHELRHVQQLQSLMHDKWGFSNQRKAQWMASFDNYVNVDERNEAQYAAYERQPIEVDANMFAEAVTSHNR